MEKWTIERLESITEAKLREYLDKCYFQDARRLVKNLCEDALPTKIKTYRKILEHLNSNQKPVPSIFTFYRKLQQKAQECLGKLLLFDLMHLSDRFIQQSEIRRGEKIGEGALSTVYKSEINLDEKWIPVALKRFNYQLFNDTSYIQLIEIDNLFNFHNPNILKIHGASVFGDGEKKSLEILTELCETTLMDIKSTTSCGLLTDGTVNFEAFKRFMTINIQIAEGLEHIHSKNCVHRDLKPQNILIQDGHVKIADACLLKNNDLVTGSVFGTSTYLAPEVVSQRYTERPTASDVYSFGIIMWEMWYNKRAFSKSRYPQLKTMEDLSTILEAGNRPDLKEDLNTFPSLKQLFVSCWDADPLKRPTITHVKETLKSLRDKYINKVV